MNLLVEGGLVVSDKVISDGAVVVEGNRIVALGGSSELKSRFPRYERLNARGCAVIPGLVNTHTHAAMTLLRGYAEDLSLFRWLNEKIWPIEAHLTPQDVQVGAELAAFESLLFGCTTLNSMYFYSDEGSELHAFEKVGVRATVGHGFFEKNVDRGLKITEEMAERWHGRDDGRLRVSVCPHAPYSTGPESYKRSFELAKGLNERYGVKGRVLLHTHVAEAKDECRETRKAFSVDTSEGMVAYLDKVGVLSEDLIIAHAIHLTNADIMLLRKYDVKPSLNPISNLKIGMGIADCLTLVNLGLTVSLGTDGPASNNTLDMFETLKMMPLLVKGTRGDPTLIPAPVAFKLATENGARALGYSDLGAIRPGYLADIVLLNLKVPHARPMFDIYNHLVYSARSSDVKTVIVNGKIVLEDRRFPNVRMDRFLDRVEKTKESLLTRVRREKLED
ncbi:MAG: amidohydrolase family protein [Nitrososphaeria archaeon]